MDCRVADVRNGEGGKSLHYYRAIYHCVSVIKLSHNPLWCMCATVFFRLVVHGFWYRVLQNLCKSLKTEDPRLLLIWKKSRRKKGLV